MAWSIGVGRVGIFVSIAQRTIGAGVQSEQMSWHSAIRNPGAIPNPGTIPNLGAMPC